MPRFRAGSVVQVSTPALNLAASRFHISNLLQERLEEMTDAHLALSCSRDSLALLLSIRLFSAGFSCLPSPLSRITCPVGLWFSCPKPEKAKEKKHQNMLTILVSFSLGQVLLGDGNKKTIITCEAASRPPHQPHPAHRAGIHIFAV